MKGLESQAKGIETNAEISTFNALAESYVDCLYRLEIDSNNFSTSSADYRMCIFL